MAHLCLRTNEDQVEEDSISNQGLRRVLLNFRLLVQFAFPDTSERSSPGVGH